MPLDRDGDLVEGSAVTIESALDRAEAELDDDDASAKVKLAAIATLADVAEDEARALLDDAIAATTSRPRSASRRSRRSSASDRRASRNAVRDALEADEAGRAHRRVHRAARARARAAARRDAAGARVLRGGRARARGRRADRARARLGDRGRHDRRRADATTSTAVRDKAFAALRAVSDDPLDAIRTALARGGPDVRARGAARARLRRARDRRRRARDHRERARRRRCPPCAAPRSSRRSCSGRGSPRSCTPTCRRSRASSTASRATSRSSSTCPKAETATKTVTVTTAASSATTSSSRCSRARVPRADAAIRGAGGLLALGDPRALGAILQLTREDDPALRRGATGEPRRARSRAGPTTIA